MKTSKGIISLAAVLALLLCIGAGQSKAAAILGGQLYTTGSDVQVTITEPNWLAGFQTTLNLYEPTEVYIGGGKSVGTTVNLGTFTAGQELVFGIYVDNTTFTFLMGPGTRNPDGLVHAQIEYLGGGAALVGIDDSYGGIDGLFDVNFRVTGVTDQAPGAPVPLVGAIFLFAPALGGLMAVRRRHNQ